MKKQLFILFVWSLISLPLQGLAQTDTQKVEALYQQAGKHHRAREYDLAIEYYSRIIKIDPTYTNSYLNRAHLYGVQKKYEQAILDYKMVNQLFPDDASAWGQRGWYLIVLGRFETARQPLEIAYALNPTSFVYAVNLGHTYLLTGDDKTARRYYKKTLRYLESKDQFNLGPVSDFELFIKNGWQVDASRTEMAWMKQAFPKTKSLREAFQVNKKANQYWGQKNYPAALRHNLETVELDPENQKYLSNVGYALLKLERQEEAATYFRKAVAAAIADKDYKSIEKNNKNLDYVYNLWPDWAIEKNKQASKLPDTLEIRDAKDTWKLLNVSSIQKYKSGLHDQARIESEKALKIAEKHFGKKHPDTIASMGNLADTYIAMGRYSDALPFCKKALALSTEVLGKTHPWTSTTRMRLASLFLAQKQYAKAETTYKEALRFRTEALGETHTETIASINSLAAVYSAQDQLLQEEPLYQRILKLQAETLGETHPATLDNINTMASWYAKLAKYAKAGPLFAKAWKGRSVVLGKTHADTLTSLGNLAHVYTRLGRYAEAEPLHQKSVKLSTEALGETHQGTITALNNLGALYQATGQYAKATQLFVKLVALNTKMLGEKHANTITAIINLGVLYDTQGRYADAEPLLEKALQLSREVLGPNDPGTITAASNLAGNFFLQGRYADAEPLFKTALKQSTKILGRTHPDTLATLSNLANLYRSQGRYTEAEPLFDRAIKLNTEVLGEMHPNLVMMIASLANLYMEQNRYEKAEPMLKTALKRFTKALGPNHPNVLSLYSSLASLYAHNWQYVKALPMLKKALELKKEIMGEKHPATISAMDRVAVMHYALRLYALAEYQFKRALELRTEVLGETHPDTLSSINALAEFYQSLGKMDQAEPLWQQGLRQTNRFLYSVLWGAGEATRQSYLTGQIYNKNRYLSFYLHQDSPEMAKEAFYFSLTRKGLLLRIASQINAVVHAGNDPRLKTRASQLQLLKQQLSNLTLAGSGDKSPDLYQQELKKLETRIHDLEAALGKEVQQLARTKTDVVPKDVLKALLPDDVLIDFLVFKQMDLKTGTYKKDHLVALVADKSAGQKFQMISLGDLQPIAQLIKKYREQLKQPEKYGQPQLMKSGQALYQKLWQPLAAILDKKKRVYIVPDGVLHLLPFPALVDKQGRYLAQSRELVVLSSGRDLVVPPSTGQTREPVIVSSPYFEDSQRKDYATVRKALKRTAGTRVGELYFTPLPGTAIEGEQIVRMWKKQGEKPVYFSYETATEQNLKTISTPRVLHLATHGFFLENAPVPTGAGQGTLRGIQVVANTQKAKKSAPSYKKEENPLLRSGLALAGANDGAMANFKSAEDDGIFTALEALGLNLNGTRLVVLSACETGMGDIKQGEGVYGLRRAFQEAGAHAVLSTLWTISDAGTQVFMEKFYTRFMQGEKPQQALRNTQLEFMQSKEWGHPFYWAPFVMVGGS